MPVHFCRALFVEGAHDPLRDAVLHVENVVDLRIEALGPERLAAFGIEHLRRQAQSVSRLLKIALEYRIDIQQSGDGHRVLIRRSEFQNGSSRPRNYLPGTRQLGDECVGYTESEKFIVSRRAQ